MTVNGAFDPVTIAYHELRAPLGLMLTAAQSAVEDCEDATVRSRCEVIARTAERMLRTTQELLRINHIGSDEAELYLPGIVTTQVVEDLQGMGLPVCIESVPETRAARATGSRAAFETLLHSLISNAHDHSLPGSPIIVRLIRSDSVLDVEISNEIDTLDRHRGLGAGRYIESQLARQVGATLEAFSHGQQHIATLSLPATFV